MQGGAADGSVTGLMNAYGPQVGLPYPAFAASGVDGALWWYEREGRGRLQRLPAERNRQGHLGGRREALPAGQYPKGEQPLFDAAKGIAFLAPEQRSAA